MYDVRQMKKKQRLAFLLCCCVIFVTAFSFAYIVQELDHDCAGTNCTVCDQIHQVESAYQQLLSDGFSVFFITLLFISYLIKFTTSIFSYVFKTPVSLKVKMNN